MANVLEQIGKQLNFWALLQGKYVTRYYSNNIIYNILKKNTPNHPNAQGPSVIAQNVHSTQ